MVRYPGNLISGPSLLLYSDPEISNRNWEFMAARSPRYGLISGIFPRTKAGYPMARYPGNWYPVHPYHWIQIMESQTETKNLWQRDLLATACFLAPRPDTLYPDIRTIWYPVHPYYCIQILESLTGTENEWLKDLLFAFNSGDVAKFRYTKNKENFYIKLNSCLMINNTGVGLYYAKYYGESWWE